VGYHGKIDGGALYIAIDLISRMGGLLVTIGDEATKPMSEQTDEKSQEYFAVALDNIEWLRKGLVILGARFTDKRAAELEAELRDGSCTKGRIHMITGEIGRRLQHEMESHLFLVVDERFRDYYEQNAPLFGPLVADKFMSANYEVEEAGKCFALDRHTACVAHLMRALEPALNSLAQALGVGFERTNWHNILDQIEKEIRRRNENKHDEQWKVDAKFYSEAATHFRFLKDAWRNYAMHLHDRYDRARAEVVFNNVRGFLQQLATRLSEPMPSPPGQEPSS
jgi:hypothetical protein